MGKVIVHRQFEGEHDIREESETCWCRPVVIEADDLRDAEEIAQQTEKADG